MPKKNTQIWYLFHSGFAVQTENCFLVFDYYNNHPTENPPGLKTGVVNPEELTNEKVLVFSSHSHHDHFNPVIFNWRDNIQNIKYILSNDIKTEQAKEDTIFVCKGQNLTLDSVKISVFGSTDRGVSFLVKVDGINIFHSGDLNWWHWENDSEKVQKQEEEDYKKEIGLLKGKKIDIAFIPVDPRLKDFYYLSAEYFIKTIRPSMVFPMHFGTHYSVVKKLKENPVLKDCRSVIANITHRGQKFVYL